MCWINDNAAAIQAICACFGLIGLAVYCVLTYKIHQAAIRQANAAMRPFVVIDKMNEKDVSDFRLSLLPISEKEIIVIRNLGTGPAIGIKWLRDASLCDSANKQDWMELGDLAVGDWSYISTPIATMMFKRPPEGMSFRFKDFAGNDYETIEECKNGTYYQQCRSRQRRS
jgi:hypothetical protein